MSHFSLPALATVAAIACISRSPPPEESPEHALLLGTWHLATAESGDRPNPGMRLTLTVDSASANTFHGRVASFFSGNVGIDPRNYRPFVGQIEPPDTTVRLIIEPVDPKAPMIGIEGRVAGDSIAIATLTIGRDTLGAARPMFFVRER